jgi:hypothetical protein
MHCRLLPVLAFEDNFLPAFEVSLSTFGRIPCMGDRSIARPLPRLVGFVLLRIRSGGGLSGNEPPVSIKFDEFLD